MTVTLAQVNAVLRGTGLPVAYLQLRQNNAKGAPPPLPRITYQVKNESIFYADGVVYASWRAIEAALYTAEKDPSLEAAVDTVLQGAEIAYTKTEGWMEGERVYTIIYEFEV